MENVHLPPNWSGTCTLITAVYCPHKARLLGYKYQNMMTEEMSLTQKIISIVIPAYNESDCVDELAQRLKKVMDGEVNYEFEVIVVENGSTDDTFEKLKIIHEGDSRFKVLKLARNFRMDGGLTAGLSAIRGDACVLMTADLQDPPEMIPSFIRKWEQGFENIYGIVTQRTGTGPIRTLNSRGFYWLAHKLSDNPMPKNASDFRLLDRKVYEAVSMMQERNRFFRGLVAWVGFKSVGVEMKRPPRFAGKSKAYSSVVIDLAFKGVFAHSYKPLRIITVAGIATSFASAVTLIVFLFRWILIGVPFGGFGTIVSLLLLAFGLLTFMLGLIAEYVGLIYEEVKARPNFIVDKFIS
jgi:polyisoprenyl-phosphate glycosyltransferase